MKYPEIKPLVNEYGSVYGNEYIFDTYEDMAAYKAENWPEGNEHNGGVWDQNRFYIRSELEARQKEITEYMARKKV